MFLERLLATGRAPGAAEALTSEYPPEEALEAIVARRRLLWRLYDPALLRRAAAVAAARTDTPGQVPNLLRLLERCPTDDRRTRRALIQALTRLAPQAYLSVQERRRLARRLRARSESLEVDASFCLAVLEALEGSPIPEIWAAMPWLEGHGNARVRDAAVAYQARYGAKD